MTMFSIRNALGVGLLASASLLFASGAQAADPIKIGVTITQSPPGSVVQGTQVKDGLEVMAKIINDGGGVNGRPIELVIEDTYGTQSVKLPAGHMVLYPATSLHHVRPVTRGARISSFFWIQSMVRSDAQRTVLFDLDMAVQRLSAESPDHPSAVQLTGIYHNLIRMWAEI